METTEKVVEAYVRYVKKWATIPNIRCPGQYEIDLIAIDPVTGDRFHIESGVSVARGYSKLTTKPYSPEKLKQRLEQAGQRRTLGYFADRKFGAPEVVKKLSEYGFKRKNYKKVIVTWGFEEGVIGEARKSGIAVWRFPDLMSEIATQFRGKQPYFIDDTLRTLHLYETALAEKRKQR
jgi:hypothetical protein